MQHVSVATRIFPLDIISRQCYKRQLSNSAALLFHNRNCLMLHIQLSLASQLHLKDE
jgi:hypothetical protein